MKLEGKTLESDSWIELIVTKKKREIANDSTLVD